MAKPAWARRFNKSAKRGSGRKRSGWGSGRRRRSGGWFKGFGLLGKAFGL